MVARNIQENDAYDLLRRAHILCRGGFWPRPYGPGCIARQELGAPALEVGLALVKLCARPAVNTCEEQEEQERGKDRSLSAWLRV